MPDHVHRNFDVFQGTVQNLREFFELLQLHHLQMLGKNLPGDAALTVTAFHL